MELFEDETQRQDRQMIEAWKHQDNIDLKRKDKARGWLWGFVCAFLFWACAVAFVVALR